MTTILNDENNQTSHDELRKLNELFSQRYTEQDPEYQLMVHRQNDPPIVDDLSGERSHFQSQRSYNNNRQQNYPNNRGQNSHRSHHRHYADDRNSSRHHNYRENQNHSRHHNHRHRSRSPNYHHKH